MRTSNSIKNSIAITIQSMVSICMGFISQAIFIKVLGAEYLGLNGLFSNILIMLSIIELGIGSAITYNLYKPIANNDLEKIKSILNFYKKVYTMVAIVIMFVGVLLIPLLHNIVGKVDVDVNIYFVYILFLLNTISTYLFTYKRTLIYASQSNYIICYVQLAKTIVLNLFQMALLYLNNNYYLYLILKLVFQVIENIALNIIANKMFPYVKQKNINRIDKSTEISIMKKVKALFFHKIGTVIINGTDNILISSYFGIYMVGVYSNYYMIINSVSNIFAQIINSTAASIGDLLVHKDATKNFDIFRKLRFINFWITCVSGTCLLTIMQPFITLWVGKEYLMQLSVLVILVINYYQKMMRRSYACFKDSAGIWVEDKFVPLIEAILNIAFSIVLLKLIGIAGVFVGTIISGLVLWCYSYPKFVYKKLFKRNYWNYFLETMGYIILFLLTLIIVYALSSMLLVENLLLNVILIALISIVVSNGLLIIIFARSENFKYIINLLKETLKKQNNNKKLTISNN